MTNETMQFKGRFIEAINNSTDIDDLWGAHERLTSDYIANGNEHVKDLLDATESRLEALIMQNIKATRTTMQP